MSIAESTWREIWEQQMINIEQSIGRAHRRGVRPDIVFIDYPDILTTHIAREGIPAGTLVALAGLAGTPVMNNDITSLYPSLIEMPMNDEDAYLDRLGVG